METLPDISDCPNGDILKCRFSYSPDYTPVIVFILSVITIFTIPKLIQLFNRAVFDKKRSQAPSIRGDIIMPFCCRSCRKRRNKSSMDDSQKIGSIAPQNLVHYKDMNQLKEPDQGDNMTNQEDEPKDFVIPLNTVDMKPQFNFLAREKTFRSNN